MFETGLWATPTWCSARMSRSCSSTHTQWAAMVGPSNRPRRAHCSMGERPVAARIAVTSSRTSWRWMWLP